MSFDDKQLSFQARGESRAATYYVTREEFLKFHEELFDKMDKDHTGKCTMSEWMGKAAKGTAKK